MGSIYPARLLNYQESDSVLTWQERYHDHKGDFTRAKAYSLHSEGAKPCNAPKVENSTYGFVVGD